MKTPLIALVASMALVSAAQADSKFYGKMNVAVGYSDKDSNDTQAFGVDSYASRVGVKGSEDLGFSKLIYQAEYETDIDGDGSVLKQRDSYVGLAYKGMGTVKMGVMDTPLKKSQGKFDLFNDVVDIKQVLNGENRSANSVNYTTEKMANVQVSLAVTLPEDGTSEGVSASVIYKADNVYASAAIDNKVAGEATQRATVIYKLGDIKLGALVNNVDQLDTADDKLGFAINAAMTMGMDTVKVQFEKGDQGKKASKGATMLTFGADHKLGKATKAFAFISQFDADTEADGTKLGELTIAMGLEHKF